MVEPRTLALDAMLVASGCGVQHIQSFTPRQRKYKLGNYDKAPKAVSEGSLWKESSRSLVADFVNQ